MRPRRSPLQRILDAITLILIVGVFANLAVIVTAATGHLPAILRYVDLVPVPFLEVLLRVFGAVAGVTALLWGAIASLTLFAKRENLLGEALREQDTIRIN